MSLRLEANRTADVSEHSVENIAAKVAANVVSVLPPPQPAPPPASLSDDELRRVAQSIGRVLEHRVTTALQTIETPRQGGEDIAQVRSVIESAFQQQRQSEEQLTAMLTTMQQALIGMLDRMDALERQSTPDPLPPAPSPRDLPAAHVNPPVNPPEPSSASHPNTDSFGSFTGAAPAAPEPAGKSDFIAAARRAAGEAQLQQQQQQQPPSKRKAQDKGQTAKPARRKAAAGSAVPRRILLALLAVVAAASAYVALTRKPARPAAPSTKIERPDAPKKSSVLETEAETQIVQLAETEGAQQSPLDLLRQQEQAGIERLAALLERTSATETSEASSDDVPEASARELPPALVGPMSLRIAARDGNPSAQFAVALRLGEGRGVGQDLAQAVRWYSRSAQQGFSLAQYRLGTYYERGLGIAKNLPRALSWYRRAAENGNVKAMHNLAVLATSRQMGEPDYVLAAQWFSRASEHGLADSLFNLAVLFESGLGVKQDYGQAYYYLALAARAGDQQAVKRLEQTRAKLSPDDASRIDNAVAAWQPKPLDPIANHPVLAGNAWQAEPQRSVGG
jgi:TPR repeat protein